MLDVSVKHLSFSYDRELILADIDMEVKVKLAAQATSGQVFQFLAEDR
jgi:hypothetical protein